MAVRAEDMEKFPLVVSRAIPLVAPIVNPVRVPLLKALTTLLLKSIVALPTPRPRVAPAVFTVTVLLPLAAVFWKTSVPPVTEVFPLKVLLPESVQMPVPVWSDPSSACR